MNSASNNTPKSLGLSRRTLRDESGSALVVALFTLLVAMLISLGLSYNSMCETLYSYNYQTGTEAFYIAEGGLHHAVRVIIDNNLDFGTVVRGTDGILGTADDGILTGSFVPVDQQIGTSGISFAGGHYTVQVIGQDSSFVSGPGMGSNYFGNDCPCATPGSEDEGEEDEDDCPCDDDDENGESSTSASTGMSNQRLEGVGDNDNGNGGGTSSGTNGGSDGGSNGGVVISDAGSGAISWLVVRATGSGPNNSLARVEAILSRGSSPGGSGGFNLASNGGGNLTMQGGNLNGQLFINGNLHMQGNSEIDGDVYATGTVSTQGSANVTGTIHNNADSSLFPQVPSFSANAIQNRYNSSMVDYVLTSNGNVHRKSDNTLLGSGTGSGWNGWKYSNNEWDLGSGGAQGTVFVEGDVKISSDHGSTDMPFSLSLIATGSITINGTQRLQPNYEEMMFVSGGDLQINGDVQWAGWLGIHEQIYFSGNSKAEIQGSVYVENVASVSSVATQNYITGNANITALRSTGSGNGDGNSNPNGGSIASSSGSTGLLGAAAAIRVISWREIRN